MWWPHGGFGGIGKAEFGGMVVAFKIGKLLKMDGCNGKTGGCILALVSGMLATETFLVALIWLPRKLALKVAWWHWWSHGDWWLHEEAWCQNMVVHGGMVVAW